MDGDRDDAIDQIIASHPDLLVLDLRMGRDDMHGWDVGQQIRAEPQFDDLPIILCSADVLAMRALDGKLAASHGIASLTKPFSLGELSEAISNMLGDGDSG